MAHVHKWYCNADIPHEKNTVQVLNSCPITNFEG